MESEKKQIDIATRLPGGGSGWRGSPAVCDMWTQPAGGGLDLLTRRSCDQVQPHRCIPEGSARWLFWILHETKTSNVSLNDIYLVFLVLYRVLLVRNFPWVAKTGSILGHSPTHCGKIICITKTQTRKVNTCKRSVKGLTTFLRFRLRIHEHKFMFLLTKT